jgi:hypothetical protein
MPVLASRRSKARQSTGTRCAACTYLRTGVPGHHRTRGGRLAHGGGQPRRNPGLRLRPARWCGDRPRPERRAPHVSAQHLHQLRPVRIPRRVGLRHLHRRSRDHNLHRLTDATRRGRRPVAWTCATVGTGEGQSTRAVARQSASLPRHRNCNVNLDNLGSDRPDVDCEPQQARASLAIFKRTRQCW